jgi:hypothetical protein
MEEELVESPTEHAREMAQQILGQLGGGQFKRMTGARHFSFDVSDPQFHVSLTFQLPLGKYKACRIGLNGKDLYDVKFWNWNNRRSSANFLQETAKEEHKDVYCEDLREVFERSTGLVTLMPRVLFR